VEVVTYRVSDVGSLINDIREHSRQALQVRLLAHAHPDVRNQLVGGVASYVKGLGDRDIAALHALLDHQEAPRVEPKSAGQT
jgi:hypothetical protein